MIGILGSGNVGANTAFFIAEKRVDDVLMYDIQEGLSEGKSLDVMEASPIRGYLTSIAAAKSLDEIMDTEMLFITAGSVRKPGMKRNELFKVNRDLIKSLSESLSGYLGLVIIVTEPVDTLTHLFLKTSGLPPEKVFGLGGFLDSTRLRYFIARELRISTENISAMVIGMHSDSMLPLKRYCSISGVPVTELLTEEVLLKLFEETREAGNIIVDMAQRASAFYAPSAIAADLAEAIHFDSKRILSLSHLASGQYGLEGVCISLPCVIGRNGIEKTFEPVLTETEEAILKNSVKEEFR